MKYPMWIVELFKEMEQKQQEVEQAEGRNFYDKESALARLNEEFLNLQDKVLTECAVYCSENGAEEGTLDNALEDLLTQYEENSNG